MRSRRRRRGRVEPVAWARACGQWLVQRTGEVDGETCDELFANSGLVLFDPSAFVATGAELRTTVRRIHWPSILEWQIINNDFTPWTLWVVVVKTNRALPSIVGTVTLGDILDGTWDVLDMKVFSATNFTANGDTLSQVQQLDRAQVELWDIKAQRILDVGDLIVAIGFLGVSNENGAAGSATGVFINVNTALSVLFQRTLT